jgi:molybdopterin-guanine dinucleotide biosynthesis protein A
MPSYNYASQDICAVVLAGGLGTRMGGVDKGLQQYHGKALAQHAAERLRQQHAGRSGLLAINANRHLADYAELGYPVWSDATSERWGPLAGFDTALVHAVTDRAQWPLVLTVPCDVPAFPLTLLGELLGTLNRTGSPVVFAQSSEFHLDGTLTYRPQPTFCLMHVSVHLGLKTYLQTGGRRVYEWLQSQEAVAVTFDSANSPPNGFANINTLAELAALA